MPHLPHTPAVAPGRHLCWSQSGMTDDNAECTAVYISKYLQYFPPRQHFTLLPATGSICEILPKKYKMSWCGVVCGVWCCIGPSDRARSTEQREGRQSEQRAEPRGGTYVTRKHLFRFFFSALFTFSNSTIFYSTYVVRTYIRT